MKKILLFLTVVMLMSTACNKPDEGRKYPVLKYAKLTMDVQGKDDQRKIDIVGDSASVHRLSRYMYVYSGYRNHCGFNDGFADWYTSQEDEGRFDDLYMPEFYNRDTIRHTFTFLNDDVIQWYRSVDVDGEDVGVDGTEYLSWIPCMENFVFCAIYDTVSKAYIDPLNSPKELLSITTFPALKPRFPYDTLGYIPNSQMRANRAYLEELLSERRYQEILDYFKSNYHIYTCTGEEYRELVRLGLN